MKTAQTIAAKATDTTSQTAPKRKMSPRSLANLVAPWKSGESGNPGGRKRDVAGDISRKVFEANEAAIYKAVAEKLLSGDAYAFSVHSDRAYGKLKQTQVHTGDEDGGPINACLKVEFVDPSVNNGDSGNGEK